MKNSEISRIESLLIHWSQCYYDGNPEVPDAIFDYYLGLLKFLDPNHELVTKTAHGYFPESNHLKKESHQFFCGSLEKIKETDTQIWTDKTFIVTPKFDGGSVVAYYNNGVLSKILSRGDGEEGFDITRNLIHAVPTTINDKNITAVRGEVMISFESAEQLNATHPRNKAVGLSQSINSDPEELKTLKIIFYDLPEDTGPEIEILSKLRGLGFTIPFFNKFNNWNEFKKFANSHNKTQITISELGGTFPIDGLVLTLENRQKSVAYKFANDIGESEVLGISWQLSRTGRYVPVLNIKPIQLSGANISRVTANNFEWLTQSQAGVGSIINIVRSNEVIPMLVGVKQPSTDFCIPDICEECGSPLIRIGKDLMCNNSACDSKNHNAIRKILAFYKNDGIGNVVIDEVISVYQINTINDIKLWANDITLIELKKSFGEITSKNVYAISKAILENENTIEDILLMANIPTINSSTANKMAENISVAEFVKAIREDNRKIIYSDSWLACYPTYRQPENLELYFDRLKEIAELFDYRIKDKEKRTINKQIKYALTGALSKPRNDIVKEFAKFGGKLVDVKVAEILIAPGPSSSAKYKLAIERKIPITTEEEFRSKLLIF